VSDLDEWWQLVNYFERFTRAHIVLVGSAEAFTEAFREKRFEQLGGGVFEALGRLFKRWVRVALYSSQRAPWASPSAPTNRGARRARLRDRASDGALLEQRRRARRRRPS
jgi:hypothetical protein